MPTLVDRPCDWQLSQQRYRVSAFWKEGCAFSVCCPLSRQNLKSCASHLRRTEYKQNNPPTPRNTKAHFAHAKVAQRMSKLGAISSNKVDVASFLREPSVDNFCEIFHWIMIGRVVKHDQEGKAFLSQFFTIFERDFTDHWIAVVSNPREERVVITKIAHELVNLPPAAPELNCCTLQCRMASQAERRKCCASTIRRGIQRTLELNVGRERCEKRKPDVNTHIV